MKNPIVGQKSKNPQLREWHTKNLGRLPGLKFMPIVFIAPSLVEAAVEGRLPRGIGVASLRDAPAEWSLQYERLGLIERSKAGAR